MQPRRVSPMMAVGLLACALSVVLLDPGQGQPRRTRPVLQPRPRIPVRRPRPGAVQPTRVLVLPGKPGEPGRAKRLSQADFTKLMRASRTVTLSAETMKETLDASLKAREANRQTFRRLYRSRPDIQKRWLATDRRRDFAAPTFQFTNRRGGRQTVHLLDGDSLIRDAVVADRLLKDPNNRVETYEALHTALQKLSAKAKDRLAGLPSPTQARNRTLKEVNAYIGQLVGIWIDLFPKPVRETRPRGYPTTCAAEEGAGDGSDRQESPGSSPCTDLNPQGLRTAASWPLKYYNTCVRNQANRGTCVAFGICAANESAIAVNYGRWVNLSEQDLYKNEKLLYFPVPPDWYGDGYNPPYSLLAQLLSQYRYPFERDWDYNPSWQRQADDAQRKYTNSCSGYSGGDCSDTNHQADEECVEVETETLKSVVTETCSFIEGIPGVGAIFEAVGGEWLCETTTELVPETKVTLACFYETTTPGSSGFMTTGANMFYFQAPFMDAQEGINTAKAHLLAKMPIVFCLEVVPSFNGATAGKGYVTYEGTDEESRGGHCVLLTGFVDNSNLPAGVSPGAGGGYFIIKNSWGTCWGDGGYAYLPYNWVKQWCTQMTAITAVSR